jgi:hypothetical protein
MLFLARWARNSSGRKPLRRSTLLEHRTLEPIRSIGVSWTQRLKRSHNNRIVYIG